MLLSPPRRREIPPGAALLVAALFASGSEPWRSAAQVLGALRKGLRVGEREAESTLDGLVSGGVLDAIAIWRALPGVESGAAEAAYLPGPRMPRG